MKRILVVIIAVLTSYLHTQEMSNSTFLDTYKSNIFNSFYEYLNSPILIIEQG